MKRSYTNEREDISSKKGRISFNINEPSETIFVKCSETIDLVDLFGFKIQGNQVFNKEGNKVLYLNINKNVKIHKKLNSILQFLNNDRHELFMVATGEGIQKMITIVEILKQKVTQLAETEKTIHIKNELIARTPDQNKIMVSGQSLDRKLEYNYSQLNYLDFTLSKRVIGNKETNISGLYDKDVLVQELKVNNLIKVPVLYVYMNFHSSRKSPDKVLKKFKDLVSNGWSIQQC